MYTPILSSLTSCALEAEGAANSPARMTWAEVRRPTRASVVDDKRKKKCLVVLVVGLF